ncbi:MAG TPA: hypothetical protein VL404_07510 [Candidatus Eisenbacteria bacterium]|nr:hypothetical protein [Candidatus Eisenbacteria bacterium]
MKTSSDYQLHPDGRFVIRDYNRKRPFSDFLPGIAGLYGTPMWAFFVNRGQGVASFGTRNKDNAILEFFPANKAYQATPSLGFRTFLKLNQKTFYEPFRDFPAASASRPEQEMEIRSEGFLVRETNRKLGLETRVRYFTVPGEPIAALAREVSFTNLSGRPLEVELLDGLPSVNPFGMNEFFVKNMSRTIEAWMVADNVAKKAPFLRLRVDATDRPEVTPIEEGNFFFGFLDGGTRQPLLPVFVDPAAVFGPRTDFGEPAAFYGPHPLRAAGQVTENRTPCAFTHAAFRLAAGQSRSLRAFYGHAASVDLLNRFAARARASAYFETKAAENRRLIEGVKGRIFTVTADPAYDLYCGQTYLDNVMRGGLPVYFGEKGKGFAFHVYSRKHGDLERDYNRFLVEPTYFSQGDGNYRDVNQNRRNDEWFEPLVGDANVRTFLNLIQLDGYNPLVTKGAQFSLRPGPAAKRALVSALGARGAARCAEFMKKPFSPGELCRRLETEKILPRARFESFLGGLAEHLHREERAEHGEGFWTDHWTYNLDLLESHLAIFPEDSRPLFFGRRDFTFHDGDHYVRPRHEKYTLKKAGEVRQFQSVGRDKAKEKLIKDRASLPSVVRSRSGRGEVYRTSLFVKLLCLFANKLATLDPEGAGVEMEADKPSWYDALNGLPGLLGSSLCETFELKRLAVFLIHLLDDESDLEAEETLPAELRDFVQKLTGALDRHFKDKAAGRNFRFWDEASRAKEDFRARTRAGLSGKEKRLGYRAIKIFLEHAREKLDIGIERSFHPGTGLYPTYFENRVERFRTVRSASGTSVKPVSFRQEPLPYFLEGPVHAMKVEKDPARRRQLLKAVRQSRLYDAKLGMYKVNAPLAGASFEIGRARVFAPGWLENESVWLHMEYKFMLETLKSGMTEDFFRDFRRALVPFQPAERYGRSILQNSSFIVSSAFADEALHGGGFVARLSGSTAEFLSMWLLMNAGKTPFFLGPDKKLSLRFQPSLPADFFVKAETTRSFVTPGGEERRVTVPKDGLAFLFLGKTLVVYRNPRGLDTFGKVRVSVKKITMHTRRGEKIEFRGDTIPSPYAARVRDEFVPRLDVELG